MSNFAWMTYLDKKEYLPGLQGLYYSLQRFETKYDLIVFYSGNVTEEDIKKYIDLDKVILFYTEPHVFSPGILKEYIDEKSFPKDIDIQYEAHRIYCRWQKSNIFGPLCAYCLIQYNKIVYLHCDIILSENADKIFELFLEDATYVAAFNKDGISSTRLMCITPNIYVYQLIIKNIDKLEKDKHILTLDGFFQKYLLKTKIIKFEKMPDMEYWDYSFMHFGGVIKYWTAFPNIKIKEILLDKRINVREIFTFIMQKTRELELNYKINDIIDKTIWKNNTEILDDFCNKTKGIKWQTSQ